LKYKKVVTSFLSHNNRILLLRRSEKVGTHRGQWSGVSGYLENEHEQPLTRAVTEIREELGLSAEQIRLVRIGEILRAFDEGTDTVWIINPFLFESTTMTVELDWENVEYRWVYPADLGSYDTVPRLRETLDRVRYDPQTESMSQAEIIRKVNEMAEDRFHGAAYLGRRTVQLLAEAVRVSDAANTDDLFFQSLFVASRLRKAHPAMANVWNLTGRILHHIDRHRSGATVTGLKLFIQELSTKVLKELEEDSEDASRNSVQVVPHHGFVLTHSYSSSVLRSLELAFKGGRVFEVYATESHPGMEGKELAKELIALGIPVTLIADSAVSTVIRKATLILVGADSVLKDGSLVHKTGTRDIAAAAERYGIPLYSSCETTKFSVEDFLGKRPEIPATLFDLTPAEFISGYITEEGQLPPAQVDSEIRELQKDIYP